ncbi:hypothetical protein HN011_008165 [Eciton burchellii]|nr:hypothetical protein HN011_008165 [Eciton burchellii]
MLANSIYYSISTGVGYSFDLAAARSHQSHQLQIATRSHADKTSRAHPITSDVSNVRPLDRVARQEIVTWSLGSTSRRYHPANRLIRLRREKRREASHPPLENTSPLSPRH